MIISKTGRQVIVAAVSFISAPSVLWCISVMCGVLEENVSLITFTCLKTAKLLLKSAFLFNCVFWQRESGCKLCFMSHKARLWCMHCHGYYEIKDAVLNLFICFIPLSFIFWGRTIQLCPFLIRHSVFGLNYFKTSEIINSANIKVVYINIIYTSLPMRLRQKGIPFPPLFVSNFMLPLDGDTYLILSLHSVPTEFDLLYETKFALSGS